MMHMIFTWIIWVSLVGWLACVGGAFGAHVSVRVAEDNWNVVFWAIIAFILFVVWVVALGIRSLFL